jgi:protein-L-isoaspartate O-methyltransferase
VHPALRAFLDSPAAAAAGVPTTGQAFVPGCGLGYDVDLFAKRGLDATGLDVAPTGAKKADEWVKAQEGHKGSAQVVCGDFFKWSPEEKFDLIYDYT